MGEWYDYTLQISGKNIVEEVQKTGIAAVKEIEHKITHEKMYRLVFPSALTIYKSMLPDSLFQERAENGNHEIHLGIRENKIDYCTKWTPDDLLANYICKHLPNEIVEVDRYAPYYDKNMHWCRKGDIDVNKEGEPISPNTVLCPTPKQIRLKNGIYNISLPIGSGDELWGTIQFAPKNVIGNEEYGKTFYFEESRDTVTVRFKNHTEELTPEEIRDRNLSAMESYRDTMRREVEISNLPPGALQRREKDTSVYYIVTIPCTADISDNGQLSFTSPDCFVHAEEGRVVVGQAGKPKPVIVTDAEGTRIKKEMKVGEIEETYLAAITNSLPLEHQEER